MTTPPTQEPRPGQPRSLLPAPRDYRCPRCGQEARHSYFSPGRCLRCLGEDLQFVALVPLPSAPAGKEG
jgi:hypothetical protein